MNILAIEFSSPQRSVAVLQNASVGAVARISEVIETSARANAMDMIAEALREAQIDRQQIQCLVIGIGPGSYNGIRSSIALAQGWQMAIGQSNRKLLAVSSVECLATQAQAEGITGRVDVVIDAQRMEFYLAAYDLDAAGTREVEPLRLMTLSEVQAREQAGAQLVSPEMLKGFPGVRVVIPRAATLGQIASGRTDFIAAEKLEPIYLRKTPF